MPVLTLPDADLSYDLHGQGPAMLFLSGTAWPGACWNATQVPEFARDHQVIVYDQRGTGASPARSDDFTTERLANDAAALLDHLGVERATVCGHSNGGRVAQMLAVEHPEKVEKLVLLSAGGTHGTAGVPIKMVLGLVEHGYPGYVRAQSIAVGSSKTYYAANRAKADAFIEQLLADLTPLETMLRHVVARQASDVTSRAGSIRVPTLVVVGDDETHGDVARTHVEFAHMHARVIPNAKLVILPGEGHYYPFYEPETTNRIIREFLQTT
jgi:pimeloyl-ACP methyl ester carboxylesterase